MYKPLKKVLHIQFGGQYLPQYSIFHRMSCIIMNAWLSCFSFIQNHKIPQKQQLRTAASYWIWAAEHAAVV